MFANRLLKSTSKSFNMIRTIRLCYCPNVYRSSSILVSILEPFRAYPNSNQSIRFFANETITSNKSDDYNDEMLTNMIKNDKIVVFMKGVPDAPKCGFSNAVVQILRMHGASFEAHNVLESDNLRKAIKDFTSWPTIPQIFFDGEFIGGCDILLEKHQNGELIDDLKKIGIKSKILTQHEGDQNE
ncbi:Glutaredoxin-related protein 5 [Sarcoptes scabiei]|uniref:Glutaredoxin-related protein 5, mitochondrial n=2 Tax=Sarcoptes scabiei TaxID=52283 RepID=A0A834RAW7_SARSC|nr:Glutaredoxin-related protein 5 [Sarcoptes scabiei]